MDKYKPYSVQKGFTLIELIIITIIIAILVSIAIPFNQSMKQRQEVAKIKSQFKSTLLLANRMALTSGREVSVCPVANVAAKPSKCKDSWKILSNTTLKKTTGWIVFHDRNSDDILNEGDVLIKKVPYNSSSAAVEWTRKSGVIKLSARGKTGQTGTLRVYTPGEGSLDTWSQNPPPLNKKINEARISLTALGKVSEYY